MYDQTATEGNWEQIRASVCERWSSVSPADLQNLNGGFGSLAELIRKRTGADLSAIEMEISEIEARSNGFRSRVSRTAAKAGQPMVVGVKSAFHSTEWRVQASPSRSMLLCFSLGMLVGFCVTRVLVGSPRSDDHC